MKKLLEFVFLFDNGTVISRIASVSFWLMIACFFSLIVFVGMDIKGEKVYEIWWTCFSVGFIGTMCAFLEKN